MGYEMTTTPGTNPEFKDLYLFHGKSAYQAAVEQGYVGTELEWIQSLKDLRFSTVDEFPATGDPTLIYIDVSTNDIYRWDNDTRQYALIGSNLVLGEEETDAYRGDRGKIAYDHSQQPHSPADAQKNSDITKDEIEDKLTGDILSHEHTRYSETTHNHDDAYYLKELADELYDTKSNVGHHHVTDDIDDFPDTLNPTMTALANDANINQKMTPGFYYGTGGNIITGKPDGYDAFSLLVIQAAATIDIQLAYSANGDEAKPVYRVLTEDGTVQSPWVFFSDHGNAATVNGHTVETSVPPDAKFTEYNHPTDPGYRHIPAGGSAGQMLRWSENGTAAWDNDIKNLSDTVTPNHLPIFSDDTGTHVIDSGFTIESSVPPNAEFTDTIYIHPDTHPATMIVEDETHRFITDEERTSWIGKADLVYVDNKLAELLDEAPETLDTLNELAKALGDDPDFAATMTRELAKKVDKIEGMGLSANDFNDELLRKLTDISETDLAQLVGVTSPIQPQLDVKPDTYTVTVDTAIATFAKTATLEGHNPVVGDLFIIQFTNGNAAYGADCTLNINGSGARPFRLNGVVVDSVVFRLYPGAWLLAMYDGSYYQVLGSPHNTDSVNYTTLRAPQTTLGESMGTCMAFVDNDGLAYPVTVYGSGSARTGDMEINTRKFPLNAIMLYHGATETAGTTSILSFYSATQNILSDYLFNGGVGTVANGTAVYYVGIPQGDGTFVFDNSTLTSYFTTTLPTAFDGKIYIYIGNTYGTYVSKHAINPIIYHDGTSLREYVDDNTCYTLFNKVARKAGAFRNITESMDAGKVSQELMRAGDVSWRAVAETNDTLQIQSGTVTEASDANYVTRMTMAAGGATTFTGAVTAPTFTGNASNALSLGGFLAARYKRYDLTGAVQCPYDSSISGGDPRLTTYNTTMNATPGLYYLYDVATSNTEDPQYIEVYKSGTYIIRKVFNRSDPSHYLCMVSNDTGATWIINEYSNDNGNAATVNGHTVLSNVPANARFTDTTYSLASGTVNGLLSSTLYTKLMGIEEGATKFVLGVAGTSLGGVLSGGDITVSSTGVVSVVNNSHTHTVSTITDFTTQVNSLIAAGTAAAATTATRLTTARTIFGHSFNGTANIAGLCYTTGVAYRYNSGSTVTTQITETASGALTCTGTFTATKVYNATFNDYAEWFERESLDEDFEPGDIVVWSENGVTKSFTANDRMVVGVYSDSYGHIVGGEELDNMEDNIKKFIPVGLSGRLEVKVTGPVERGDLIVTSDLPGIGMANNDAKLGSIIGKAITNKNTEDVGKIKILIMNH